MSGRLWMVCLSVVAMASVTLADSAARPDGGEGAPTGGWPTWRGNAARSAVADAALPEAMELRWVRRGRTPSPAWPASQHKIRFDVSFEPVASGGRLFVPSMVADCVSAYDTDTGGELWRFYTDGPVRFAPLAWRDNLYIVSDDGFLYCLDAADGAIRWKLRGGPDGRMVLGNDRLVSAWPARGAPVLWESPDGGATLYFAASIWPFMGVFLHAVDAATGQVAWTNSGSGSIHVLQQHDSPAFAGVSPQGYLAATEQFLLVAGGRTAPAVYDRRTGEFLYFHVSSRAFGKGAGGYDLGVAGEFFFNNGCMYRLADGEPLVNLLDAKQYPGVLSMRVIAESPLTVTKDGLEIYHSTPERIEEPVKDRQGNERVRIRYSLLRQRSIRAGWAVTTVFFQAGRRVYGCGSGGLIGSVDLSPGGADRAWTAQVDGEVWTMIPADGKLFVVTTQGTIYCFGAPSAATVMAHEAPEPGLPEEPGHVAPGGYAMLWGLGEGAFDRLAAMAREHHVIAIDPDAPRVAALRRRLDEAGLYGTRVHLLVGEPAQMDFPPYLASRIEFGELSTDGLARGEAFVRKVFHCLRPYGGAAECRGSGEQRAAFARAATAAGLPGAALLTTDAGIELRREGPLPGSAAWTHQYADVANTVVSRDELVKPPLGLLWFGGPSNDDILPRHGHGPSPQVVGGRLFIEGPNALRAVDVYTGRLLWQRELKGLGKFYDNTSHQAGAGEIGGNYVSLADGIYVVHDRKCLLLDPATGRTVREFSLPGSQEQPAPHWGYVGIYEDLLIAGSTPLAIRPGKDKDAPPTVEDNARYASSSRELVVMNRHSGQVLWRRQAQQVFRHNTIVAGAGRIFCIDAIPRLSLSMLLARPGEPSDRPAFLLARPDGSLKHIPVLLALDARTGEVVWRSEQDVFGTWLGYSAEHDLLLEAGSPARDRAFDEAAADMAAYRGQDGKRLWQMRSRYEGTPILHEQAIYTDGGAFRLLSGEPLERTNPLTGRTVRWSYARDYGCNTPIGGRHMLLFRSAAAGFYDLGADAGTGNWGGFKSGCTANLIPADGVLSAPDYTRTCTCSYQNQCSLALVPMSDVEVWTFQAYDTIAGPLRRVGVNFGAPGDWPGPDGTLWLEQPSVGGKGPDLGVQVHGQARYFRRHALDMQGPAPQVTASGVEGATAVRIPMRGQGERNFTIRLYFSEPAATAPGQRVFDVWLQGKPVLTGLDVWRETGGALKGLSREFRNVPVDQVLTVELRPAGGTKLPAVLCGIEAVAE